MQSWNKSVKAEELLAELPEFNGPLYGEMLVAPPEEDTRELLLGNPRASTSVIEGQDRRHVLELLLPLVSRPN
jgi:hypothetical protein